MKYLHVKCGGFDLLFDIEQVVEIVESEDVLLTRSTSLENSASGTGVFREQTLDFCDMAMLFNGRVKNTKIIIIDSGVKNKTDSVGRLIMIAVNDVVDIKDFNRSELVQLPEYRTLLDNLIGSTIYNSETESFLFCICFPFCLLSIFSDFKEIQNKSLFLGMD